MWAPLGLGATPVGAARLVYAEEAEEHPEEEADIDLALDLGDRVFTARSPRQALRAAERWARISRDFGGEENRAKAVVAPHSAAAARKLSPRRRVAAAGSVAGTHRDSAHKRRLPPVDETAVTRPRSTQA